MDDADDRDLQDPDTWDYEHAELLPPVANPQAVVAVTFEGEDFILVAKQAEQAGMKLSEFIREAALEKVAQQSLRLARQG